MKPPPVSITVTDLTLRFPVYGVDAKSLKKAIARVTVGGVLGQHAAHGDAGDRLLQRLGVHPVDREADGQVGDGDRDRRRLHR